MTPTRPALRYHGGKWLLAPWIVSQFPPHQIYTEAFGGAASVLLRKPRSYAEIYNDLDEEVVSFFRVLRDNPEALQRRLRLTPFSRQEYVDAYESTDDPIERAARTVVKAYMGFGSDAIQRKSGFRANSDRSGTTPAHDWAHFSEAIEGLASRFQGVVIENRDAIQVIREHDRPGSLHYVDPPYPLSTRTSGKGYRHEMEDEHHRELAKFLKLCKGMVVVSSYESPLYESLFKGWRRVNRATRTMKSTRRVEVLWMNFTPPNRLDI